MVPGRCYVLATCGPGEKQGRYGEESLVLGVRPELTQDRQPRVAAVADEVVIFAWTARDGRRRIQAAFTDGSLDFLVGGIALLAWIVIVGTHLVYRHDHRRVDNRVAQGGVGWTATFEPGGKQLASHVL